MPAQVAHVVVADGPTVQQDLALGHVVETLDERDARALPAACLADEGDLGPRLDGEAEPVKDLLLPLAGVRKVDAVKFNRALEAVRPQPVEGGLILWVRLLRIDACVTVG